MQNRLFSILLITTLTSFCFVNKLRTPAFTCEITSDKAVYKIGETPKLEVKIINNSNKSIYLIGALEGSDERARMPYCFYTIEKPKPDKTRSRKECKWINPIRSEEFIRVDSKKSFNPFQTIDQYGFWSDDEATNPESYKNAVIYKIQFHYSTKSKNLKDYMGHEGLWGRDVDSTKVKRLFNEIANIEITSNQIEITFEK